MFKPFASLSMLAALALVVGGAVNDTASLLSYPVVVSSIALLLAASTILPSVVRSRFARAHHLPVGSGNTAPGGSRMRTMRIVALCAVWIAYALTLTTAGFVVSSTAALIASLWISMGRFSWKAALSAVMFALALAILVTTVLFVPVPKAAVDFWIDESVYTLTEGRA